MRLKAFISGYTPDESVRSAFFLRAILTSCSPRIIGKVRGTRA
jgi:hypothetical protein